MSDIIEASKAAIDKQHEKGLKKYGGSLDDTAPSAPELIDHAIEEAADQLNYLVALRGEVLAQAELIKKIEYVSRKASLCDAEKLDDIRGLLSSDNSGQQ